MKIHISSEEMQIVKKILQGSYDIIVFGSRAKGTHQPFSDLDICLKGDKQLSQETLVNYKHQFSDSNLPYRVDLIDYHAISESFRKIINEQGVVLN